MSLLTLFAFAELTIPDFLMLRFLLVVFLVRMWFPKALLLTIFPDPVFLKRLAAPRFVFIFGITFLPIKQTYVSSYLNPLDFFTIHTFPDPSSLPPVRETAGKGDHRAAD
jgi:hypothetical protein